MKLGRLCSLNGLLIVFLLGLAAGAVANGHLVTAGILAAVIVMRLAIVQLGANPPAEGRPRVRRAAIAIGLSAMAAAIATFLLV